MAPQCSPDKSTLGLEGRSGFSCITFSQKSVNRLNDTHTGATTAKDVVRHHSSGFSLAHNTLSIFRLVHSPATSRLVNSSAMVSLSAAVGMYAMQKKPLLAWPSICCRWLDFFISATLPGCFRFQHCKQTTGNGLGAHLRRLANKTACTRAFCPKGRSTELPQILNNTQFCLMGPVTKFADSTDSSTFMVSCKGRL